MTIDINGDVIDEITIDGQNVTEVTVDGDIVFQPPAIPDSVVDNFESADSDPRGPYESGQTIADYYGGDTDQPIRQTGFVYEGEFALEVDLEKDVLYTISSTSGLPRYPVPGEKFSARIYITSDNSFPTLLFATQTADTSTGRYELMYDTGNTPSMRITRVDGSGSSTGLASSPMNVHTNQWLEFICEWATNGDITFTLNQSDGSQIGQINATDATYTSGGVGFKVNTSRSGEKGYLDDYRVVSKL